MDEKEHRQIDTWADGYAAWAELLDGTTRTLIVVDHDLSGIHLERNDLPDRLLRCLRRLPPDAIRLVVRDTRQLLTHMPRTRQLLVDYSHIASVRVAAAHHASALDRSLVVCDQQNSFVRPQFDHPRARLMLNDPADAGRYLPQLETIWAAASNANIGAVLGL